jgi:hypothetical protein
MGWTMQAKLSAADSVERAKGCNIEIIHNGDSAAQTNNSARPTRCE